MAVYFSLLEWAETSHVGHGYGFQESDGENNRLDGRWVERGKRAGAGSNLDSGLHRGTIRWRDVSIARY